MFASIAQYLWPVVVVEKESIIQLARTQTFLGAKRLKFRPPRYLPPPVTFETEIQNSRVRLTTVKREHKRYDPPVDYRRPEVRAFEAVLNDPVRRRHFKIPDP
jgi:hypothetical protein